MHFLYMFAFTLFFHFLLCALSHSLCLQFKGSERTPRNWLVLRTGQKWFVSMTGNNAMLSRAGVNEQ